MGRSLAEDVSSQFSDKLFEILFEPYIWSSLRFSSLGHFHLFPWNFMYSFFFLQKYRKISMFPWFSKVIVLEFIHLVFLYCSDNHTTPMDPGRAECLESLGSFPIWVFYLPFWASWRVVAHEALTELGFDPRTFGLWAQQCEGNKWKWLRLDTSSNYLPLSNRA